jgi:hypothetical protein
VRSDAGMLKGLAFSSRYLASLTADGFVNDHGHHGGSTSTFPYNAGVRVVRRRDEVH